MASALARPERYEIDSDRLNWPLDQSSGVPGLPEGVTIMPPDGADSHQAVLKMPCASGKTFTVRRDLVPVAATKLVIGCMCNRLFTRATCADWSVLYGEDNVYCYLDGLGKSPAAKEAKRRLREMCERGHGVIFVSIESFLVLNGVLDPSKVGALLLEETCELATKMLSETCKCVRPFRLLRDVARGANRLIYTDADFEADDPEMGRCLLLAKYLRPDLPVRIFTLSRTVEHVKRSAKLYFDHKEAEAGANFDAWVAQLRAFLQEWRVTGDASGNRVGVACSSRAMVRRVCGLAKEAGCFWCDYTSDTSDAVKNAELGDPATYWVEVGLVAFTQTLCVGVDPQKIQFAAVFVYAASFGCSIRCLLQGALRFGRDVNFPLLSTTVFICLCGRPEEDGPEAGVAPKYYEQALDQLRADRAERLLAERGIHDAVAHVARRDAASHAGELHAYGGVLNTYVPPDDEELAIAAWSLAETIQQRVDPYSLHRRATRNEVRYAPNR